MPSISASKKKTKTVARTNDVHLGAILAALDKAYPNVTCALDHHTPLQLLIATILSAQCTDERVNQVTPELFRRYPDARSMANAPIDELEKIIHSTGFYRAKAKSIQGTAHKIITQFGGQVPKTMDELTTLPGVARKTANVVLGTSFGIADGVVVDTHVKRLSARLGLTHHTDPKKVEQDLIKRLPRQRWISFSHQLIWHGRLVCQARKPHCEVCTLASFCPSSNLSSATLSEKSRA